MYSEEQKSRIANSIILERIKSLIYEQLDFESDYLKSLARKKFKLIKKKQIKHKYTNFMEDNYYFFIDNKIYGDIEKNRFGYRIYEDCINSNCKYKDIRVAELGGAIILGYHRQVVINNKSKDVYVNTRVQKSVYRDEDIKKYTLDYRKQQYIELKNKIKEQRKKALEKVLRLRKLLNSFRHQFAQVGKKVS